MLLVASAVAAASTMATPTRDSGGEYSGADGFDDGYRDEYY